MDAIVEELRSMSDEDFKKELEKRINGDIYNAILMKLEEKEKNGV